MQKPTETAAEAVETVRENTPLIEESSSVVFRVPLLKKDDDGWVCFRDEERYHK